MLVALDVKLGRGGDANSHIGNVKFRQLIGQYKPRYMAASRSNKPFVAEEVVQIWRNLNPSGRFLIRTDPSLGDDSTWHDVGDRRARKKASQALREKDRSEDLVASLMQHHHHHHPRDFWNGSWQQPPAPSSAPAMAPMAAGVNPAPMAAGINPAANPMMAAAAAAMVAAANEQSRKRTRQPDATSVLPTEERRVAPRQEAPSAMDPAATARALQQLLQSQASTATAPVPPQAQVPALAPAPQVVAQAPPAALPAPALQATSPAQATSPGASSVEALVLPILQVLLQQKQQERQQREQNQQVLSNLTAALQSLTPPNQAQQSNQLATVLSDLLGSSAPAPGPGSSQLAPTVPASQLPISTNTGTSQPQPAPAANLLTQALAAQLATAPTSNTTAGPSRPVAASPVPNLFAQAAPSQPVSGQSQTQHLDRLMATQILASLFKNSNATQKQNGM